MFTPLIDLMCLLCSFSNLLCCACSGVDFIQLYQNKNVTWLQETLELKLTEDIWPLGQIMLPPQENHSRVCLGQD